MNKISVSPKKFTTILVFALIFIISMDILINYLYFFRGWDSGNTTTLQNNFIRLFNVRVEWSIPTFFNQLLILIASALALVIALSKKGNENYRRYWFGLSAILFFLSVDEGSGIHEIASSLARKLFGIEYGELNGTFLQHNWVIVVVPAVVFLILIFFRFWWNVPSRTKWSIFVAAAVYVGGAAGLEMVYGQMSSHISGFPLQMISTTEEMMEKLGMIILIWTLLDYLKKYNPDIQLNITSEDYQDFSTNT